MGGGGRDAVGSGGKVYYVLVRNRLINKTGETRTGYPIHRLEMKNPQNKKIGQKRFFFVF